MQNNNLIDLKKAKQAKKDNMDQEAEYLAKLQLLRLEKQEKMRHEAASNAILSAGENYASEISESNEEAEENNISRNTAFSSRENTFWLKLGKSFLYILIFLLPLFFLPTTIYPIDANKQFLAVFLVSAALICYLANVYFTRRIIYSKSILSIAAVFFVVAGSISAFFSVSPNNSLFGDFTQADVLINFIICSLVLYLTAVFFKKDDFNTIGITFLASMILVSFLGLLQLLGIYIFQFDFTKQIGFNVFGSVINYDIFITFGLVLIIASLVELNVSLKVKAGLFFAGLLILLNLILINYQATWILLAIMMMVYAVYKFAFKSQDTAALSMSSGAPLLIGIFAFVFALVGPSLPKIINNMPNIPIDIKPNLSATLNISKDALGGLKLLTGTGLATFSTQYNSYRPVELNQSNFWRIKFNQGFSFASTQIITGGIIGILSILLIIFAFMRIAIKNIEDKNSMVVSIGIFFMVLGWFYFPASFVGLVFSFIALGLLLAFDCNLIELNFSKAPKSKAVAGLLFVFIFTAGAISMLYFSGNKYVAAYYFQKGIKDYNSTNVANSLENILKAISFDQTNDQYLRSMSQLLLIDAEKSRDLNIEVSKDSKFQDKIAAAVQYAKVATEVNSADAENWYNSGDIYEKIIIIANGADIAAEKGYLKAAELNPKNPDPLIGQAKVLMFTARQAKDDKIKAEKLKAAIDVLEKAVSLKSDYAYSHFQLGLAYAQSFRNSDAIKEFEFVKLLSDNDAQVNFQLGMLYYNGNDLDKAKMELENAISLDPNFSNARYVLGLIYNKKGLKDSAIGEFENILKLNPSNKEVMDILNNLKTKGSAFEIEKPLSSEDINDSLNTPETDKKEAIDNAG